VSSIAGVKFGTPCDHLLRKQVTAHWDPETTTFWARVYSEIDAANPQLKLYVNDEMITSVEPVLDVDDPHYVTFTGLGFGEGGFGQGGFGVGLSIPELGQYPADDVELEFRVVPNNCPKCYLTDPEGKPLQTTSAGGTVLVRGFGDGGFGGGGFGVGGD